MKKITIIMCIVICAIGCYIYITTNERYETSNIDQYEEMQEILNGKSFSSLDIFPKEIKEAECTYFAKYRRKNFDFEIQQFLECKYTEDTFQEELQRLSNLEAVDQKYNLHHPIIYDVKSFCYPAYVMTFQSNYCYEYALVNMEHQKIIYIYLQHSDKVDFDNRYLDKDYQNYIENGYSEKGFDQYEFSSNEIEAAKKN